MTRVHITFDVEVWCNDWRDLDSRFPAAFERYCFGRSRHGAYALPKTLEILQRHKLVGVFFVEPLFAARFGLEPLRTITNLIIEAGQDVQLHLHPEWTDEIDPPPIADVARKRQHLTYYTVDEQTKLIALGRQLLEEASGRSISAFRSGSFAANRDTYLALRRNGILVDSSLNAMADFSKGSLAAMSPSCAYREVEGIHVYPVSVFMDGLGRKRPAQVGSASLAELQSVLTAAAKVSRPNVVLVSHNFEMLKPGSAEPDWTVVRRFEGLCAWLAERRDLYEVGLLPTGRSGDDASSSYPLHAPAPATLRRHIEQLRRRLA